LSYFDWDRIMPRWDYQTFYRRVLPHWQPGGVPLFITWRLAGSLPKVVSLQFEEEQQRLADDPRHSDTHSDWAIQQHKRLFARWDDYLHQARQGPRWLEQPEVAQAVRDVFHQYVDDFYTLYAYVIMANHVHILIQPLTDRRTDLPVPLRVITQRLKGSTARYANLLLNRTGQAFWAQESYDHWARNPQETARIINYIVNNPVKAGIVKNPEDWPWTWVSELFEI